MTREAGTSLTKIPPDELRSALGIYHDRFDD